MRSAWLCVGLIAALLVAGQASGAQPLRPTYVPLIRMDAAYAGDGMGAAVVQIGDLTDDGIPDWIVGAPDATVGADNSSGRVYVFSGWDGRLEHVLEGAPGNQFGCALATLGDVDGDGTEDFAVGAPRYRIGAYRDGCVYVISGADFSVLRQVIGPGTTSYAEMGSSLSRVYDLDGDGADELLIGDTSASSSQTSRCGRIVVYSPATDTTLLDVYGPQTNALFGWAVSCVADVSGDGRHDLLVGAPELHVGSFIDAGAVYVIDSSDGATLSSNLGQGSYAEQGRSILGLWDLPGYETLYAASTYLGAEGESQLYDAAGILEPWLFGSGFWTPSYGWTHDIDGDTLPEIIAGEGGGVRVVSLDLSQSAGASLWLNDLDAPWEAVTGAGDVNADGKGDVAVGAPDASPFGREKAGSLYVYATPTIFGKVTDVDGETPLPGASVQVWLWGNVVASTTTDAAGRYWAADLEVNHFYTVAASAEGRMSKTIYNVGLAKESVYLDIALGTIAVAQPNAGSLVGGIVSIEATAQPEPEIAAGDLFVDGAFVSRDWSVPLDWNWDSSTVGDGPHTLTVWAYTLAGDQGSASVAVTVDNTPPETSVVSGPTGTISEDRVTFGFTAADAICPTHDLAYSWRLDGAAWSPWTFENSVQVGLTSPGVHVFEVKARDTVGNEDPSPAQRVFTVEWPAILSSGYVQPATGDASTKFTWRVKYWNTDGIPAQSVFVGVWSHDGGVSWRQMWEYDPTDSDVTDGKWYTYSAKPGQAAAYRFAVTVAGQWAYLPRPSGAYSSGPDVNPITLSSGYVTPTSGQPTTDFTWRIKYWNTNNAAPDQVWCAIWFPALKAACWYPMWAYDPTDTDYRDGAWYTYSRRWLPPGAYAYRFAARQGSNWAYWPKPPGSYRSGPSVGS